MDGIELIDVSVARSRKIVARNVNLVIRPGEATALLGANGAGKSTLVMAIAGLLPLASGKILIDGKDLAGLAPEVVRRRGIVVMPEGHPVFIDLSVRENLEVAGAGFKRSELANGVEEALAVFPELRPKLAARAGQLSGGQQQILCLAGALIGKPRFLLADELSLGLAPTVVSRLISVITRLIETGVGTLLIEQFTRMALSVSRHAYVLERGSIKFGGMVEELQRDPDLLEKAYLAHG